MAIRFIDEPTDTQDAATKRKIKFIEENAPIRATLLQQIGREFAQFPGKVVKGAVSPFYKAATYPLQSLESMITQQPQRTWTVGMPSWLGGNIVIPPLSPGLEGVKEAAGVGLQGGAILGAGALPPSALGALISGGQAMEEGKTIPGIAEQTALGALIGKGIGVLGGEPLVRGRAGEMLERSAEKSYTKALGATTKGEKIVAKKLAPELAKRKPFVWSRAGWARGAGRSFEEAATALEKGYNELGEDAQIVINPILNNITKQQNKLKIGNTLPPENTPLYRSLDKMSESIMEIAKTDPTRLQDIRQYRQVLDEAVIQGKKIFPTAITNAKRNAQRIAANAIRNEIAKQHPNIGRLNAEFTFQSNLQDLLLATAEKGGSSVMKNVSAGVGSLAGNPGYGIAIRGLGALIADNVAWNTLNASIKARLTNSLIRGDIYSVNNIIKNIATVGLMEKRRKE